MALLAVVLGVSQHVSGIGMTLLATGLAFYFYRLIFGQPAVPPNIVPFQPLPIPLLSDIPFLGPVFFSQTSLTYIAFLAVPVDRLRCSIAPPGASTSARSARTRAPPTPPASACGACAPRRWSSAAA